MSECQQYFAVYSGREHSRGHTCIVRANNKSHALRAARSNGIPLAKGASAYPLTVQAYAGMLRHAGFGVSGIPEQTQLMFS
jgi:hypothetical protein